MIPSTFFKLAFDFAYALGVARSYILHGCRLFIEPRGKRGTKLVTYDGACSARLSRAWALYRLCHLQPRSPCRLDVFWCGFGRVVLFQIFLKDYGRGNGIHGGPGVLTLALFLRGFRRTQEVAALFFE